MLKAGTRVYFQVETEILEGTVNVAERSNTGESYSWRYYIVPDDNDLDLHILLINENALFVNKLDLLWKMVDQIDEEVKELMAERTKHCLEISKLLAEDN